MSDLVKIFLPKLGESIVSATVVQWFKKVGDSIARDEPLLEVATDKVNSEIPSPVAGVLQEIAAQPDQELQVGELLGLIAPRTAMAVEKPNEAPFGSDEAPFGSDAAPSGSGAEFSASQEQAHILSPAVLRLLQEKQIPLANIDRIPRSGEGGRLTKKDVEGYCPLRPNAPTPAVSLDASVERVKMSAMRKAIADNMVKSFYEAPHASLVTEVDVTHLVKRIAEQKALFLQTHGVKLTITPFAAHAIACALQAYPLLNASLEADTIVMKKIVNLGIAVSVEQGVMVPVVRSCQSLSFAEIAQAISQLAGKARAQSLSAHDVQEGTITMTNFGMTGAMIGIPIIRYPEVAIVGLGAIVKKVVVLPGDQMAIRSMMMVSLTFDHRVLDGLYGCGFLNELKTQLEKNYLSAEE